MAYRGRVSQEAIEREENRLKRFVIFYVIVFILMILLVSILGWPKPRNVLIGNILFSVGSGLVFGSVIQIRYFDVKKNSNPGSANPGKYSKTCEIVEIAFKHLWVLGSIILFISRWV